jgi:hypothetical protein
MLLSSCNKKTPPLYIPPYTSPWPLGNTEGTLLQISGRFESVNIKDTQIIWSTYYYDALNRVTRIVDSSMHFSYGKIDKSEQGFTSYTYDQNGLSIQQNSKTESWTYFHDSTGLLTRMLLQTPITIDHKIYYNSSKEINIDSEYDQTPSTPFQLINVNHFTYSKKNIVGEEEDWLGYPPVRGSLSGIYDTLHNPFSTSNFKDIMIPYMLKGCGPNNLIEYFAYDSTGHLLYDNNRIITYNKAGYPVKISPAGPSFPSTNNKWMAEDNFYFYY